MKAPLGKVPPDLLASKDGEQKIQLLPRQMRSLVLGYGGLGCTNPGGADDFNKMGADGTGPRAESLAGWGNAGDWDMAGWVAVRMRSWTGWQGIRSKETWSS